MHPRTRAVPPPTISSYSVILHGLGWRGHKIQGPEAGLKGLTWPHTPGHIFSQTQIAVSTSGISSCFNLLRQPINAHILQPAWKNAICWYGAEGNRKKAADCLSDRNEMLTAHLLIMYQDSETPSKRPGRNAASPLECSS